jgi:hypothetical protein
VKSLNFQRGSGCFKCSSRGRLTRHTTSDNPDICGPCYELAGFENGVTDNGEDHIAGYLSDAISCYKKIISKGSTHDFTQSPELGAAVLAAIEPLAPWTIARNPALSNRFATMYTLYWRGLVRGQLVNHTNA